MIELLVGLLWLLVGVEVSIGCAMAVIAIIEYQRGFHYRKFGNVVVLAYAHGGAR